MSGWSVVGACPLPAHGLTQEWEFWTMFAGAGAATLARGGG